MKTSIRRQIKRKNTTLFHRITSNPYPHNELKNDAQIRLTMIGRIGSHFCTAGIRHQNLERLFFNNPAGANY